MTLKEKIESTKKYQKIYQAHYRRNFTIKKRKMITTDIYNFSTIAEDISNISTNCFTGSPDQVCSEFGCKKVLNYREILFGSKCINHSKK